MRASTPSKAEKGDKKPTLFTIQIRMINNETIQGSFEPSNLLREVKTFVDRNRTDGTYNYVFALPFPRKKFGASGSCLHDMFDSKINYELKNTCSMLAIFLVIWRLKH